MRPQNAQLGKITITSIYYVYFPDRGVLYPKKNIIYHNQRYIFLINSEHSVLQPFRERIIKLTIIIGTYLILLLPISGSYQCLHGAKENEDSNSLHIWLDAYCNKYYTTFLMDTLKLSFDAFI